MNPSYQFDHYVLKRQILALTGTIRIYNPQGELLLFSRQKMFRLREDIRVYRDESKAHEMLHIQARNIIDFSAAYDVIDSETGQKYGALRRKGLRSMLRDEWEVLDIADQPIGLLFEDDLNRALLRRFLLGSLLPQNYDLTIGEMRAADMRQRFSLIGYTMDIDFSMDSARRLDRRVGLAAAILLGTIEGKQAS